MQRPNVVCSSHVLFRRQTDIKCRRLWTLEFLVMNASLFLIGTKWKCFEIPYIFQNTRGTFTVHRGTADPLKATYRSNTWGVIWVQLKGIHDEEIHSSVYLRKLNVHVYKLLSRFCPLCVSDFTETTTYWIKNCF